MVTERKSSRQIFVGIGCAAITRADATHAGFEAFSFTIDYQAIHRGIRDDFFDVIAGFSERDIFCQSWAFHDRAIAPGARATGANIVGGGQGARALEIIQHELEISRSDGDIGIAVVQLIHCEAIQANLFRSPACGSRPCKTLGARMNTGDLG